ncbi:hypothetical protein ACJJTC_016199 [Scirpophaga incertulas]
MTAPAEIRPPSGNLLGPEALAVGQAPPRPPLNRVDSRSSFQQPARPVGPPQTQPRPQFQPGGPVTTLIGPRPGTPAPRGPLPTGPPGNQQARPPPLRPFNPQSITQQRPPQSPTLGPPPQRQPPPTNLHFGPRQPLQFGPATTPDSVRPTILQTSSGIPRNGVPNISTSPGPLPRQPSQGSIRGLDQINTSQSKPVILEDQSISNENQHANKTESNTDIPNIAKGRSYSIAAAPGEPSPFKMDEDRRKSISTIGGKIEEFSGKSPALGLIQEGKTESRDTLRSSHDSIKSTEVKDIQDRPESRFSGSKMSESVIRSLSTPKKKTDDDDDVISQNNSTALKRDNTSGLNQNKTDLSDRSPSLTRSEESPEPKQISHNPAQVQKHNSITPEVQNISKNDKHESKTDNPNDMKTAVTPSKGVPKSPVVEAKPPISAQRKPNELNTSTISSDSRKSTPRKVASAPKARPKDGDNDSGVDESTQGHDINGSPSSPNKKMPSKLPTKEKSSSSLKQSLSRSSSKSATAKTPENPLATEKKKVPMNKVQVGNAPSPNIKAVKSKIGSLDNATYKPGGGKVKIENRKIEFNNVTPKIAAKNDTYAPSGGTKKITTTKLEWNAKSKIGSLQNTAYKPGGGDKKIETVKLDFKEKAKPKVASTVNITHKPGGGTIKIENQKLEFKAQSKVGSLGQCKA